MQSSACKKVHLLLIFRGAWEFNGSGWATQKWPWTIHLPQHKDLNHVLSPSLRMTSLHINISPSSKRKSGFINSSHLWSTDTPAPCRVRCPIRVRVSVRHRHDTRIMFYILDITCIHVFVSVSCRCFIGSHLSIVLNTFLHTIIGIHYIE